MVSVVVVQQFADKDNFAKKYSIGETIEVSEERSKELESLGLVKVGDVLDFGDDELTAQIESLKAREIAVGDKEVELTQKETELNQRELKLKELEDSLTIRESALDGTNSSKAAISIDLTKQWQQVIADVKECADLDVLEQALKAEKANDKPRPSVSSAIQDRINELIEK